MVGAGNGRGRRMTADGSWMVEKEGRKSCYNGNEKNMYGYERDCSELSGISIPARECPDLKRSTAKHFRLTVVAEPTLYFRVVPCVVVPYLISHFTSQWSMHMVGGVASASYAAAYGSLHYTAIPDHFLSS